MTMTNPALIDAVRMLHNSLFVTSGKSLFVSSGRYRRLIRATTETNTEGSVCEDEIIALLIMREVAFAAGNAVIAVQKLADLHDDRTKNAART